MKEHLLHLIIQGMIVTKLFNLERSYSPITNKVLLSFLQIIYSIRPLTIICINWYDPMYSIFTTLIDYYLEQDSLNKA